MKRVSIILLIVMVSMASCAKMQEKETAKESESASFQPKPLDDDWFKWLIGKWEVTEYQTDFLGGELEGLGESNEAGGNGFAIELALNGQFLIWKPWPETGKIIEMTDEERDVLRRFFPDEEIERFLSMPYKSLYIQTIDPKTGERIMYAFDSQRVYGQGRGRLEGNKEIMEWELSGISRGFTGISIMEKISSNKFTYSIKYTQPNGKKMEEELEMTRKKTITGK